MKMTTKLNPNGPRFKMFEFWIKVAKVTKPQKPLWQFTLIFHLNSKNTTCLNSVSLVSYLNIFFRVTGVVPF
ncbi:hypothetical protein Hanom_Chr06g00491711 [Helianthus anomalus]